MFTCIDNKGFEDILTIGKEYKGQFISNNSTPVYIYKCDDGIEMWFTNDRFIVD